MLQYIGIDESTQWSRHGKDGPEIYVAVLSSNPVNFLELPDNRWLPKPRMPKASLLKVNAELEKLIKSEESIEFFVSYGRPLRSNQFALIRQNVLSSLVVNMLLNEQIDPKDAIILVDGASGKRITEKSLAEKISIGIEDYFSPGNISFEVNGDRKYPVINSADRMAYCLGRIFKKIKQGDKSDFDYLRINS